MALSPPRAASRTFFTIWNTTSTLYVLLLSALSSPLATTSAVDPSLFLLRATTTTTTSTNQEVEVDKDEMAKQQQQQQQQKQKNNSNVKPGPPIVDLVVPPMGYMKNGFHSSSSSSSCQTNCRRSSVPGGGGGGDELQQKQKHCPDETMYKEIADVLVSGGYSGPGYKSVHLDECWSVGRDSITGELVADPDRFPGGIQKLAQYMHNQGLTLGIYGDLGEDMCNNSSNSYFVQDDNHDLSGSRVSSLGYEDIDAATFAKWGIDYVTMVDGCSTIIMSDDTDDDTTDITTARSSSSMEAAYTKFGLALKKAAASSSSGKGMVYSCLSWPTSISIPNGGDESQVPYDIMYNQAGCNTWRNWKDVGNNGDWEKVKSIIFHWADNWEALASIPIGSFNNADVLIAGEEEDDDDDEMMGTTGQKVIPLPVEQAKLQFGFWALISSPLLIGGDVRKISSDYRSILLNGYVVAVNQDLLRNQAKCQVGCEDKKKKTSVGDNLTVPSSNSRSEDLQVWTKHLDGYSIQNFAFGFFNLGDTTADRISYKFPLESMPILMLCADLWSPDPSQSVCPPPPPPPPPSSSLIIGLEDDEKRINHDSDDNDSEEWDFQYIKEESKDDDGSEKYYLEITALNVPPTSHQMLRIYMRYSTSDGDSTLADEVDIREFHDEVFKLALQKEY